MDEVGVSVTMPRLAAKRIHCQNTDASIPNEYYRRVIYVPLVDSTALDLRTWFNKSTMSLLAKLRDLIPCSVLRRDVVVDVDGLLGMYSGVFTESGIHFKLHAEVEIWKQKWLLANSDGNSAVPVTCTKALQENEKDCFPTVYNVPLILLSLPVSVAWTVIHIHQSHWPWAVLTSQGKTPVTSLKSKNNLRLVLFILVFAQHHAHHTCDFYFFNLLFYWRWNQVTAQLLPASLRQNTVSVCHSDIWLIQNSMCSNQSD